MSCPSPVQLTSDAPDAEERLHVPRRRNPGIGFLYDSIYFLKCQKMVERSNGHFCRSMPAMAEAAAVLFA